MKEKFVFSNKLASCLDISGWSIADKLTQCLRENKTNTSVLYN